MGLLVKEFGEVTISLVRLIIVVLEAALTLFDLALLLLLWCRMLMGLPCTIVPCFSYVMCVRTT